MVVLEERQGEEEGKRVSGGVVVWWGHMRGAGEGVVGRGGGQSSLGGVVLSRWTSLWRSKSFAWQRRLQDLTGVGHNIQVAAAPPDQLEERWDHLTLPG